MNAFVRLSLAALMVCALASTLGAKPAPKAPKPPIPSGPLYFFNIQLDPRYQIVGVGPLTAQQAATANCYCFTYDAHGKIQRIEFDRAGVPMSDPFFRAARIDFEYAPGVEHRWYRDGYGQPVTNLNGVEGEDLTLNSAGYPTQVTNRDGAGGAMRDFTGVMRTGRSTARTASSAGAAPACSASTSATTTACSRPARSTTTRTARLSTTITTPRASHSPTTTASPPCARPTRSFPKEPR
jgi:hypothetical protein